WRRTPLLHVRARRTRPQAPKDPGWNHRNCRRGHPKEVPRHTESMWSLSPVRFALRTLRLRWREREQNSIGRAEWKRDLARIVANLTAGDAVGKAPDRPTTLRFAAPVGRG